MLYKKKKGTSNYNYVVDYVCSTLGIIFCGLLFSLLLGYSIATIQLLIVNRVIQNYILLTIILVVLPIIPAFFLVYVIRIYLRNLKRKSDDIVNEKELDKSINNENIVSKIKNYDEIELVKKNG